MQDSHTPPSTRALPSRREVKDWLKPWRGKQNGYAVFLLIVDWIALLAMQTLIVVTDSLALQIVGALLSAVAIARLFVIGHDACHQSYTSSFKLNHVLGRIAFLPSLTPYALWEVGHNTMHHGFTNLKGRDFVWTPLSAAEYSALSRSGRIMYRLYRSIIGAGPYYFVEIWWRRMFFPNRKWMPIERQGFMGDCWLVAGAFVVWVGLLVLGAWAAGHGIVGALLWGFVVPFALWNVIMGTTIYVHHTHPAVVWFDNKEDWMRALPYLTATVHLKFPASLGKILHDIMEHPAHHLDMSIPLYRLKRAQRVLTDRIRERMIVQRFSLGFFFDTVRRCKLYDYEHKAWMTFREAKAMLAQAAAATGRPAGSPSGTAQA
jgi:omega-6 fatty acid desaturase (delta-12 desaturase)